MKCNIKKKQSGFSILIVLIAVVALIGALAAWLMSGQSNTSSTSTSGADVTGSSIVNDGISIKTAFDLLLVNGVSASNITFVPNTAGAANMLDTTSGISKPVPNANAVSSVTFPSGAWIYNATGFKGNAIGTAAVDQAMVVFGVKDAICAQINNRLRGSTAIPVSGLAVATVTTGATAAAPTATGAADISAVAAVAGWDSGCMTTLEGADKNMFFRVLKAN